ncbi:hypothetical protein F0U44_16395 [Nocardioides humilatus]|uniref:Lipoprotein n=1 Tax=Nocardioides humilatus TaxID=2607660 RepID=A0A5B1L879_9ACTN|nr:hypothetical protein [Nocardioides humilatus]KAA1416775.1 hypothetical protein F0U44_16395 [Nocardioides humilatus]
MAHSLRLLVIGLLLACSACGATNDPVASDPFPSATLPTDPLATEGSTGSTSTAELTDQVLFDRPWVVEEGVWFLTARGYPRFRGGQTSRVLNTTEPGRIVINAPALYGKYAVRIETHTERPPIPEWCEDVVEVSLEVRRAIWMGSFESFSRSWRLPAGDYRVRYCATGLDLAAAETAEDEFDGNDYRLYSGRQLFQLWQAPYDEERDIRIGSDYVRSQLSPED